jgi:hypothetical protein
VKRRMICAANLYVRAISTRKLSNPLETF